MIVRKITNNLFDVFSSTTAGWDHSTWSRIQLNHKTKQANVVGGAKMREKDLVDVVNTQILPQLQAEYEYNKMIDKIKHDTSVRIKQKLRFHKEDV